MTRYYLNVSDELADRLQKVSDDQIVEALEKIVEENEVQSELAAYNSVKEILNDESKTQEERKRLELRWQRRVGRR